MNRIIALDIGTARIGVAVSDPFGTFSQALTTLDAKKDWVSELAPLLDQYAADTILVGLPRRTDGTMGPEAASVRAWETKMQSRYPDIKIIEWDERFTTVIATQLLIDADVSRRGRKNKVDKIAAAIILQSYLDSLTRK